jgi:Protein of unknown function (DUF3365)
LTAAGRQSKEPQMSIRHFSSNPLCFSSKKRLIVTLVGAISAGIGAALVLAMVADVPAVSRTADDDTQIAKSLATLLRAGRTVISRNQDRINDPNVGNKGLDGKMVLAEATKLFQQATEIDPSAIQPSSLQGKLIHMQLDAIAEVMDVHQETINRQGVGFKGFIPAVFGRLVNEAFGRRAAGIADMKVTAPPKLIRNPKVQPDEWELEAIQTRLMSSSWPKDQSYTATAAKDGVQAQRTLFPEYYGRSCLSCHGSPAGEIDITGFPKEGASEGDLGGIISITLYR